jgi:DNA-binding response OmpR family regulator
MIVDDEPDVCEIIKYHTQKAGFRTVIAHNGIDAAAKMNIETPSMIILDLMMPGQSGYEFLRSMNAAGYGRIPVSIITARRMDSSTDALLRQETNVVDLFPKPFDVPQFIASVRRHAQPAEAA